MDGVDREPALELADYEQQIVDSTKSRITDTYLGLSPEDLHFAVTKAEELETNAPDTKYIRLDDGRYLLDRDYMPGVLHLLAQRMSEVDDIPSLHAALFWTRMMIAPGMSLPEFYHEAGDERLSGNLTCASLAVAELRARSTLLAA